MSDGLLAIAAAINNLAEQVGRVATVLESRQSAVDVVKAAAQKVGDDLPRIPISACDKFLVVAYAPTTKHTRGLSTYDLTHVASWDEVVNWTFQAFHRMTAEFGKEDDAAFGVSVFARVDGSFRLAFETSLRDAAAVFEEIATAGFDDFGEDAYYSSADYDAIIADAHRAIENRKKARDQARAESKQRIEDRLREIAEHETDALEDAFNDIDDLPRLDSKP